MLLTKSNRHLYVSITISSRGRVFVSSAMIFHHVQDLNQFLSDDKYHPEEVQGFFNTTPVSILSLSSDDTVCLWPISRLVSYKSKRICFQLYTASSGKNLKIGKPCLLPHAFPVSSYSVHCRFSLFSPA